MRSTLSKAIKSVFSLNNDTGEGETSSDYYDESIESILPKWWLDINDWLDNKCENFYSCYWYYLCLIYGIIALAALIQLIRIQQRAPEFGWTTQKLFHFMNFIVFLIRSVSFGFYEWYEIVIEELQNPVINLVVFDLPGLMFFTTYTLLVLFWAEIYHQASGVETESLKPAFININIVVYVIQIIIWVFTIFYFNVVRYISATWMAAVSLGAVIGFLVYGCRLFSMLRDFPIESRGRKRKLNEVGCITFICTLCFTIRFVLTVMIYVKKEDFDLDLLNDDLLNIIFYVLVEILPAISVLAILHRLPPPKRISSLNPKAQPRIPASAEESVERS